jgi:alpha-beta hydrolase superfamily lysophospholipase
MSRPDHHLTADGTRLARYAWQPTGPVRALVLLAHGFGEHAGRYGPLAAALTARGFALQAVDHLGHGRSQGERAFVPAAGRIAADFLEFTRAVAQESPGVPLVLLGHSMGGATAAQVALLEQDSFAGLILSAPYLEPGRPAPAALRAAVALLARVLPRAAVERIPPGQLSRISAAVTAYETDPLVHHGSVTARSAHSLLSAGAGVLRQAPELTLPLLILHGTADAIAGSGGSRKLHEAASSADRTLRLFPDARHELLNDEVQHEFLTEISDWLDRRFPAAESG